MRVKGRVKNLARNAVCQSCAVPSLSVLMPARNAERTIGIALRSTLRAMPRDSELIVLDDASGDRTAEIARATGDPRVEVVSVPENIGLGLGSQLLLDRARGEFVARMDADDVCLPGRFRAELRAARRGSDLVFSTYQVIGAGPRKPVPPIPFGPDAARLALLLDCPYPHSTALARADALRAAGGYDAAAATEDYDLWLRAAARGSRVVRLALPTILLRASPGQVTAAPGWRARLGGDAVLKESYRDLVESLWGTRDTPWFPYLAFGREAALPPEGRAVLEPFVERFLSSLSELRTPERLSLSRRARQELGWRSL